MVERPDGKWMWLWQLLDIEQQEAVDRRNLEKCMHKGAQHQLHESDDEEMHRKLKVSFGSFFVEFLKFKLQKEEQVGESSTMQSFANLPLLI